MHAPSQAQISGFFFYVLARDYALYTYDGVGEFWQTVLSNVYDVECYYTWSDYIEYGITDVEEGAKTPQ